MVVGQQDVDVGLDASVLEGIIQQDDLWRHGGSEQLLDAMAAVSIYGHAGIGKLLLYLEGFVAQLIGCGGRGGQYEAFAASFVATA